MDKNKKNYPPEYDHIGEQVKKTQERIQQIDEQIKNVPQNSKPAPALRPPGFVQPKRFDRERTIGNLENEKNQIKHDMLHQAEQEVRGADPKTARTVKDNARESLFPNPFLKMGVAEKNRHHDQSKDIETSQDYMDSLFSRDDPKPVKDTPEKQHTNLSISALFVQNLSFTKAEKLDPAPTPSKEADKAIDRD